MFRSSAKLLLAALLCVGCATASAADLYVICNARVHSARPTYATCSSVKSSSPER
jgi:hypothetical protein